MPTLEGFDGRSLVPNITGTLRGVGQGLMGVRALGRDMQADQLAEQANQGDVDALAMLGRFDPQAAQHIGGILEAKDAKAAAEARGLVENRARLMAGYLQAAEQGENMAMNYLVNEAQRRQQAGEPIDDLVQFSQLPGDRRNLMAQRDLLEAATIGDILKPLLGGGPESKFGRVIEGQDESGNPVFFAVNDRGDKRIIPGVRPTGRQPQKVQIGGRDFFVTEDNKLIDPATLQVSIVTEDDRANMRPQGGQAQPRQQPDNILEEEQRRQLDFQRQQAQIEAEKAGASEEAKQKAKALERLPNVQSTAENLRRALSNPDIGSALGARGTIEGGVGRLTGSKAGQLRSTVSREVNRLTSDAMESLKGSPSDADLLLIVDQQPRLQDAPEIWIDWYNNDFVPRYNRAFRESYGVDPGLMRIGEQGQQPMAGSGGAALDPDTEALLKQLGL